uniref:Uncharacterized protein n=1 Tax=Cannabis sativa TaxID=3483 RepID=A0A803PRM9_CANSA
MVYPLQGYRFPVALFLRILGSCSDPSLSIAPTFDRYIMSTSEKIGPSKVAGSSSPTRKKQKLVVSNLAHVSSLNSVKDTSVGFAFPRRVIPFDSLEMHREREVNRALKGRLEAERLQVRRLATVMSVVRMPEMADDMHAVPPVGQIVEVEALKNRLPYRLGQEGTHFVAELLDQVAASASELPTETWASCSNADAFRTGPFCKEVGRRAFLTLRYCLTSGPTSRKGYRGGWRTSDGAGEGSGDKP